MRTILFGAGSEKCDIKLEAYDMRERYTSTSTLLGTAQTNMADQKHAERIRLKLESPNPDGRTAGFVTITSWMFDLKIVLMYKRSIMMLQSLLSRRLL